ncbi:MAG: hypothetical protein JXB26_13035 [Candidatus Aminicenantes bacterium]|nr:hypothetical protein [Candidatus Aminicenantes bacterium]
MKKFNARHTKSLGFSLVESLLCLSLFLILLLGGLEVFAAGRRIFFKLKTHQETMVSVSAALHKIKTDLQKAGYGLLPSLEAGLLKGINLENGTMTILQAERFLLPAEDFTPGQTSLKVKNKPKVKAGRKIAIFSSAGIEIRSVTGCGPEHLFLKAPLENSYTREETTLALIRKTALFFDTKTDTVRREINDGSAQPLFEGAALFELSYDEVSNLVRIRLASLENKEKIHEFSLCPENISISLRK